MRPLILISSLRTGGAERVTVWFMCQLIRNEIPAQVCTVTARLDNGTFVEELLKTGVVRHDLSARRLVDPLALIRLIRLIKREKIDIVHAHGQEASILAGAAKCFTNVRLVITRHVITEPSENWRQKTKARLTLEAIRFADAVIAVSSSVADRLANIADIPRSEIIVIHNGIELEKFDNHELRTHRNKFRSQIGFGPNDIIILVPSVLREGKGHDILLKAIPFIRSYMPSAYFLVAGSGDCENELHLKAQSLGNAVRFLGEREDMPELLSASDLIVLPSLEEAFPTVLLESAAAARPVVATSVGGTTEIVEHGKTGLLVPPNDPSALGEAVIKVLSDQVLAGSFGEEAYKLVHERFSVETQIDRTYELWSQVMKGARL